ncbi:hypothetical protein SRABI83_03699 [Arthrobacter sp. Bi83]|jgi:hypothetical protein|uniref:DUF2630 family protein n=1 Tax=Arthrobacter sp. Bi83 TaxID=2822353 RepID=UPI001D8C0283|nr:DUF2630 family protein [Arthrobacter sp. Bi83]CAH0272907.1 hypothetical protein SRABI83_03699 [Arthrobacter sp. Bi83]
MDNQDILQRIQSLVDEEHRLREVGEGHASDGASPEPEDRLARLRQVEEALDQCWDLLRQRRAKAKAGEDPDEADVRPASEVEGYRQ